MELDGEAPEGVGEDVTDGVVEVVVAVILEGVAVVEQPFARIAEGLEEPMLGLQLASPDLRVIRTRENHFYLIHSL